MEPIPVMRPRLPRLETVLPRLAQMESSGQYSNHGPQVRELEARYGALLGVDAACVVATSSGTVGLAAAVAVSKPTSWRVPSFTFPATPLAVLMAGNDLTFIDVDADSWTTPHGSEVSTSDIGTVVVMPFGARVLIDFDADAQVVVDAAASLGACLGRPLHVPQSWSIVFSLHATKVLPAGEGGLVVCGDQDLADALRAWINFGFRGSRVSVLRGFNGKMSEASAAYAHASLDGWAVECEEWQEAQERAERVSREVGLCRSPGVNNASPYWVVQMPSEEAVALVEQQCRREGIDTRRWWGSPCDAMPAFGPLERSDLSVTRSLAATTLGLPMFRGLSSSDADRICSALETVRRESGCW